MSPFAFGWRFRRGDLPLSKDRKHWFNAGAFDTGAAGSNFDDSGWSAVDLPHDFVIEGKFSPRRRRFDQAGPATKEERDAHALHGFLPVGVGWYRKRFRLPRSDLGRTLYLEFDGVYRDCQVWLNGHYLGRHHSGYTSFRFNITDVASYGGENVLAVRVDASEYEIWSYAGGGIYRHVRLVKTDPLHVAPWGTFVRCDVKAKARETLATITIETKLLNDADRSAACRLVSTIIAPDGRKVAAATTDTQIPARGTAQIEQTIKLRNPTLWSVDQPQLYKLVSRVRRSRRVVDEYETPFGIRTFRFEPGKGCFRNGRQLKIKGGCCHQNHAGLGIALPDRVHEFRIEKLKEMGCNAYRTAHHPHSAQLLEACDRLGMLVINEHRFPGSSDESLAQLESMILRDRNHPSVIMYLLANEEGRMQDKELGVRVLRTMKRLVQRLDPTRPVTAAMNNASKTWGKGFSKVIDVQGCNYTWDHRRGGQELLGWSGSENPKLYDSYHRRHPKHPMIATEVFVTHSTRGIYKTDTKKGYLSAYDRSRERDCTTDEFTWEAIDTRPFVSGVLLWAGIDYAGEPPSLSWPLTSNNSGPLDLCCFPKDSFYYYKAWWSDETVLHIFPHWNWRKGQMIDVWCHTNCQQVELFLNGRPLGRKDVVPRRHLAWRVKYQPGELLAIGYRSGKEVARHVIETTGPPAGIHLVPDRPAIRADNHDVAIITVEVVDDRGRVVPTAANAISFEVSSNARIIGVGNGDPASTEPPKANKRRAFNGLCQVIVQSTRKSGSICLTARAKNLRTAQRTLRAKPCKPQARGRNYLQARQKA